MNIVFMGTPSIAQSVLAYIEEHVTIRAVYTRPDKPAGRGKKTQYSPVKQHALNRGYPIEQPSSLRSADVIHQLQSYHPDCIIVVAYGALLPQEVLDIPYYGAINVHGSLLPYYRGAAPIQRALWNGEAYTGASIMKLDNGMDTGDVLLTSSFPIEKDDTTYSLMEKMATIGSRALGRVLSYYSILQAQPQSTEDELLRILPEHPLYQATLQDTIKDYVLSPLPQDNSIATYAPKITREDEYIHWDNAISTHNQIQALSYSPSPTASTILYREGMQAIRVKIPLGSYYDITTVHGTQGAILGIENDMLCIACSQGIYAIPYLRPENKKDIAAKNFYNGYCKGKQAYFGAE